jgi:membrane protease YdiL (CAAX protease family)
MTEAFSLADAIELTLALAGVALLWRFARRSAAGADGGQDRLAHWEIAPLDLGLAVWAVFAARLMLTWGAQRIATGRGVASGSETYLVWVGPAFPVGAVLAYAFFRRWTSAGRTFATPQRGFALAGLVTFLLVLPLVEGVAFCWQGLLQATGLPADPQDVVNDFVGMKSSALRAAMVLYAVVLAPVAEELVFRGLLFRFARGRLPRWGALLLPAAVWAALHGLTAFAPLLALGVVLELAYERTGNLAVPMCAHALFNLNTILVLLLDPPT